MNTIVHFDDDNDDSCDLGPYPAATLLLPYFDVDVDERQILAKTTSFTVINTTRVPQIADVTLWTDWGYPVLDFDIFLTGYDAQAIDLYDVLARGLVAPDRGTSHATTPGLRSAANNADPSQNWATVTNAGRMNCSRAVSGAPKS